MKVALFFLVVVVVLFLLGLMIVKNQEYLIFPGFKPDLEAYKHNQNHQIRLTVESDLELTGWVYPSIAPKSGQVLIYIGGNAQDVISVKPTLEQLPVEKIYTFNYRGLGQNGGKPSEEKFYQDAEKIYELVQKENPTSEIVVVGFSLGSAVAGHIATQKDIQKLVLICPLKSMEAVAKARFTSLISRYIRYKFDLHSKAPKITSPTLIFIAGSDKAIPPTHSKATYDVITAEKELVVIGGASHNSIFNEKGFISEFSEFLK